MKVTCMLNVTLGDWFSGSGVIFVNCEVTLSGWRQVNENGCPEVVTLR